MEVVAGVIHQNNRILLARRSRKKDRGGKWEFPGGKIEKNESAKEALTRELMEELQIHTHPSKMKTMGRVKKGEIHLHLYSLPLESTFCPREHEAVAWVSGLDRRAFDLCECDEKALSELEGAFLSLLNGSTGP